ncbi:MAG TPA: VCBS repeat-containing protein, partial [Candidatus Sulfotelmatobacter sp.]
MAVASAQNPVPQIVGPVRPSAVVPGSGAFTLNVYGANFVPGAIVDWNGQPRSTTFISARELQSQILATDVAQNTAGLISVTNPGPGGGASSSSWAQVEVHAPVTTFAFKKNTSPAGGWDIMVADFNHDGILDYVGQYGGTLDLYYGKGDGTFHFDSIADRFYSG